MSIFEIRAKSCAFLYQQNSNSLGFIGKTYFICGINICQIRISPNIFKIQTWKQTGMGFAKREHDLGTRALPPPCSVQTHLTTKRTL